MSLEGWYLTDDIAPDDGPIVGHLAWERLEEVTLMGGPADQRKVPCFYAREVHVPVMSGMYAERHVYVWNPRSPWAWYAGRER